MVVVLLLEMDDRGHCVDPVPIMPVLTTCGLDGVKPYVLFLFLFKFDERCYIRDLISPYYCSCSGDNKPSNSARTAKCWRKPPAKSEPPGRQK